MEQINTNHRGPQVLHEQLCSVFQNILSSLHFMLKITFCFFISERFKHFPVRCSANSYRVGNTALASIIFEYRAPNVTTVWFRCISNLVQNKVYPFKGINQCKRLLNCSKSKIWFHSNDWVSIIPHLSDFSAERFKSQLYKIDERKLPGNKMHHWTKFTFKRQVRVYVGGA